MAPTHPPSYEQLEQRLAAWAAARPDVRAIIVIGSRSRTNHPPDAWSDLDCILFVDDTAAYKCTGEWQRDLEAALEWPVWFAAYGTVFSVDPEWEYVLAGGLKMDLTFSLHHDSGGTNLNEIAAASAYHDVFASGARVLVDKSDTPLPFQPPTRGAQPWQPDQAVFDNLIANLLLELVRAAKLARRGELWRAARAVNEEWQQNLLKLLEWHAQAAGSPGAGDWAYGRFLEEWADPRALAALPDLFAAPTLPAVRRAVLTCLALIDWLGPETAALLDLVYPTQAAEPTARWLEETLE